VEPGVIVLILVANGAPFGSGLPLIEPGALMSMT
jgi:hypothetical protein